MFNDDIAKFVETGAAINADGIHPDVNLLPVAEGSVVLGTAEDDLSDKAA